MSKQSNNGRRHVILFGGFARMGGIESFFADLLEQAPCGENAPALDFVCWSDGAGAVRSKLPKDVVLHNSPVRWGCNYGIPDLLLVLRFLPVLLRAERIILGKQLTPAAGKWLLKLKRSGRLSAKIAYITPYRPKELWGELPPLADFELFDEIFVQAPEFADDLFEMGFRGDVHMVPYIPPRPQMLGEEGPRSPLRIGSLGRLAGQKNLYYLIDIVALLKQREPDLAFDVHIYGDGALRESLDQHAEKAGVANLLTFHGAVAREEVPAMISGCDLFLITSDTEGQCLVALEILSAGRPLIATAAGALPVILSSSTRGALIPFSDAAASAEIVAAMCKELNQGRRTRQSVINSYLEDYDTDTIAGEYARLFGW